MFASWRHGPSAVTARRAGASALAVFALAALALASLPSVAAGTGSDGRVKGRFLVDNKPVKGEQVTLSPFPSDDDETPGTKATTDAKGRFSFNDVAPGRYKLYAGLTFELGDGEIKCKIPGYSALTLSATNDMGDRIGITALDSKKPIRVKAGKVVTRNIKAKCKPKAVLVPPVSEAEGSEPLDSTEEAFLAALDDAGLQANYADDEAALTAGREACDEFRAEKSGTAQLDPFTFDFNLLLVAVPYFCPDLSQFITEAPAP